MSDVKGINQVVRGFNKFEKKSISFLSEAMMFGTQVVATKAKQNLEKPGGTGHGGKHILSGVLQKSIEPGKVKVTEGAIHGSVEANTDYAVYEEARHPFLLPAATEKAAVVKRVLRKAFKRLGV